MVSPTSLARKIRCNNCGHVRDVTDEWMRELKKKYGVEHLLDAVELIKCHNGCDKKHIEVLQSIPNMTLRK